MARTRRDSKVRLARRALLAVFVIFLGVVSAIYFAGRGDRAANGESEDSGGRIELIDLVSAGEGFEYEATEEDRRLFRIRADRVVQNRDNLIELEKAFIEVTRDDGRIYEIRSNEALYRADERERVTELNGNAVVTSDSGAEVRSRGFELRRKGRLVASKGPVRYRLGDRLQGTADYLEAYLSKDRYQLSGDVKMVGGPEDPSFSLSCRRLIFEEQNRRIYAEGDVRLTRRGQEIRAGRVTVTLAEDSDDVRFVRARFNVSGEQRDEDDLDTRFRFETHELSLAYDEETGDPRRAELDSRAGETVWVESSDASQVARRLTAPRLTIGFDEGEVRRVGAFRRVVIREYFLFDPGVVILLTCSKSAVAEFSAVRGLEEFRLVDRVDLHQGDVHAVGRRVIRRSATDSTELEGDPARIYTPRGELEAPSVTFGSGANQVEASGGVRALMPRTSGFSMIRDESVDESPVTVTSEEASWDGDSGSFSFSGQARAWQNEDYIVAETITGEAGGARLRASGSVKTVIKSRRSQAEQATREERAPIEVAAGEMVYEREAGVLRYRQSPVARQAGRTVRCQDMQLELDEDQELERMICRDSVSIEDPEASRSIDGDLAIYRPADSLLEVGGQPAVLENSDGGEVRGSVLIYDLETGVAKVRTGILEVAEDEGTPE